MGQTCKRRPGRGGAAAHSLAGDAPHHNQSDPKALAAIEAALDRAWFVQHPDRAHRVRHLIEGEQRVELAPWPANLAHIPPWPIYVAVKKVALGLRMKVAFWGSCAPCDCEDCAADLWLKFAPDKFQAMAVEAAAIMLRERP